MNILGRPVNSLCVIFKVVQTDILVRQIISLLENIAFVFFLQWGKKIESNLG